jgi:cytochrome c-type biogenesis protein CcmE
MKGKTLLGCALIVAAVAVVIIGGLAGGSQYFLTVSQLRAKSPEIQHQSVRVSGAVVGESIQFDAQALHLEFDIVDSVEQIRSQPPLRIVYDGPKPELLQPHAQAIVEGRWDGAGTFHADSLLLKCPTRYEEQFPEQVQGN